jgi:hypothetical protein
MKWRIIIPVVVAALIVAGCVPTRFAWSPDGQVMTVLGDDAVNFADADGNLTGVSIKDVNMATWFPDSKRVLVVRQINPTTWNELAPYLTADQVNSVVSGAQRARAALMVYNWGNPANPDSWDQFQQKAIAQEDQAKRDTQVYRDFPGAVATYLRDHADDALRAKIPAQRWLELKQLTQAVNLVQVYAVDPSGATAGATLMSTLHGIHELRVSPTGEAAIIVLSKDKQDADSDDLWLADTDASRPAAELNDQSTWHPDWSPDGRDVVFVRKVGSLATLTRARVADDSGRLLEKFGATEDLVGMLYDGLLRVRCLKDGRIVFNNLAVTLPAAPDDLPQHGELFAIMPGKEATVSRLVPKRSVDQIGDNAQYFEISPDGAYASIPDSTGKVTVIELATGKVTEVQGNAFPNKNANDQDQLQTIPQWRSPDELTFMVPGEKNHPAVVLWSLSHKSGKVLSANWPGKILESN